MEANKAPSQSLVSSRLIDPTLLATWIAERPHIWQMDFLTAGELSQHADQRGLKFWSHHITQLWQLGFLKADLVVCNRKSRRVGLKYCGTDRQGQHLYGDVRRLALLPSSGWSAALSELSPDTAGINPLFHPFRYYVLYRLERSLELGIVPMQTLVHADRYHELLDRMLSRFSQWASSPEFLEAIEKWNAAASLAIVTEPCMYPAILEVLRYPGYIEEETQRKYIDEHWVRLRRYYKRLKLEEIEKVWRDICFDMRCLEPNEEIHTLLCLGHGDGRLKIRGHLGGAMVLRTMAEMIRRTAEQTFNARFPEEDDNNQSWVVDKEKAQLQEEKNWKVRSFGSPRLLDGNWQAADEFARQFGLRFGHHLRWYVEGDTEFGALRWFFGQKWRMGDLTLINLHGEVAEKAKKGVAFRESLRADIQARRFSFVSIDGDRSDFFYALRKAAQDDEICGAFFVSKPDFESENFDDSELKTVLWSFALAHGATQDDYQTLQSALSSWQRDVNDLFSQARRALPHLAAILKKGELWGNHLMEFAWEHQHTAGKLRPIIEAIHMAIRTRSANYFITRQFYQVDPETGNAIRRPSPKADT